MAPWGRSAYCASVGTAVQIPSVHIKYSTKATRACGPLTGGKRELTCSVERILECSMEYLSPFNKNLIAY